MAKRGRKEIPFVDKRRHGISCRLTNSELKLCDARRGEHTRGEWMRMGALTKLPPVIPALNREAWIQLSHAAANLNQLSRTLNSGDAVDAVETRRTLGEFRLSLLGARNEGDE